MEPVPQNVRLVRRAYWLIRLRWIAIAGVVMAVFLTETLINVPLAAIPLYTLAAMLAVYNTTILLLLNKFTSNNLEFPKPGVKRIINIQMSADLFFLTLLLHFSGGIENPFVIYFVFHMILSSILLSPVESYLQATLGTALLLLMTVLEYNGLIEHYHLQGFIPPELHTEGFYLFCKVGILSSAFYLVVFMTSSIAVRSRNQEEGYRLANIELETKDRVKDEYVARVTHDIKGHLAAIQSCVDVVSQGITGPLNDKQQEFVDRAGNRTRKLSNFVRSLLKLTKIRLSNQIDVHPFNASETLDKAIAAVEIRANEKSIMVSKACKEPLGDMIGSALSIEELITNLMLNAIKYTPNGGRVVIKAENSGKFLKIAVSDTGIGIPAEDIGHVFEEFFRASNAQKTEKDGTGLGLAIAKQIVERHGGKITAKSAPNEGSTFTFTLAKKPQ
jgi:signal transduction histidine kinase